MRYLKDLNVYRGFLKINEGYRVTGCANIDLVEKKLFKEERILVTSHFQATHIIEGERISSDDLKEMCDAIVCEQMETLGMIK